MDFDEWDARRERRERMWATYGKPDIVDAVAALQVLGITEVTPTQVIAMRYRDQEAADAYAAANLEQGLSMLGTYDVPGGVVGVLDLRPEIARLDAEREKG